MLSRIGIALALVCLLKPAATVLSPWAPQDITLPPPPCADTLQISKLTSLLVTISDWIMQSGVGSNQLNNATYWDPPDAIFINANLARVLLAAYKITGNADYVAVGLQWCDSVVKVQQSITTSTGKSGGYCIFFHFISWMTSSMTLRFSSIFSSRYRSNCRRLRQQRPGLRHPLHYRSRDHGCCFCRTVHRRSVFWRW